MVHTTRRLHWKAAPPEEVLEEAERNFRHKMLGKRGRCDVGDALDLTLSALGVARNVFHPLWGEVELNCDIVGPQKVEIGRFSIEAGKWTSRLRSGDWLRLYCLSAGAPSEKLWDACGGDPVLASAAHLLGSEVVYALSRRYDAEMRNVQSSNRWVKLALLSTEGRTERCRWDPAIGREFFKAFAGTDSPVRISEAGSFDPLHTVLGLFWRPVG